IPFRAADRNLLFGILALQMDFISRDALIEAMHAWVLEKAKPLGPVPLRAAGREGCQLPAAKRTELAKSYGDRAMETLRQAVAKGYKDAANLKKEKALDPLRSRDDFKKLLAELEKK